METESGGRELDSAKQRRVEGEGGARRRKKIAPFDLLVSASALRGERGGSFHRERPLPRRVGLRFLPAKVARPGAWGTRDVVRVIAVRLRGWVVGFELDRGPGTGMGARIRYPFGQTNDGALWKMGTENPKYYSLGS